jgi:hypothetical protein
MWGLSLFAPVFAFDAVKKLLLVYQDNPAYLLECGCKSVCVFEKHEVSQATNGRPFVVVSPFGDRDVARGLGVLLGLLCHFYNSIQVW